MKCAPALLLGVALTTSAPLGGGGMVSGVAGTAPVFAADDTSAGMASVSDSKLSYGAASTGDKGWPLACISIITCDMYYTSTSSGLRIAQHQFDSSGGIEYARVYYKSCSHS